MPLYRYRTCVLAGPWRSSRSEALRDALRARQAERNRRNRLKWRVPGEIEQYDGPADGGDAFPRSSEKQTAAELPDAGARAAHLATDCH